MSSWQGPAALVCWCKRTVLVNVIPSLREPETGECPRRTRWLYFSSHPEGAVLLAHSMQVVEGWFAGKIGGGAVMLCVSSSWRSSEADVHDALILWLNIRAKL